MNADIEAGMEIQINKKEIKQKPIVIEGFPGFGLVGTIVTEFLVDHLNAQPVGKIFSKKIPAVVAIHKNKVMEPFSIFYDKKNNIILIRAIAIVSGLEWELTDMILKLCKDLNAKELISIEGVGPETIGKEPTAYYFSTNEATKKKFESIGLKPLEDGVILGVTGSLLSKAQKSSFIFAESQSQLPDSRAAAKIIEVLDKYLGLKVDYKPLIKKAEEFEDKLKGILTRAVSAKKQKNGKEAVYVG